MLKIPVLFGFASLMAAWAEEKPVKQPIYIYMFSRVEDHLNLEMGEEKIRRTVPLLDKLREQYPQYGSSCLFQFTGAVSNVLAEFNNGNHIVDFIKTGAGRHVLEVGYDGDAEPTDLNRPRPNFRRGKTPEDRWLARTEAWGWFLTEFKNLVTGEPDPDQTGGLKKTQEIFGEAAFISRITAELGGDPELVHVLRRMNTKAILPGLPESFTYPARNIHGYGGSVEGFGSIMSPGTDCTPELFWQDGYVRMSDTSSPNVRPVVALKGVQAMREALAKVDRSRPHVIQLQLGHDSLHHKADFLKGYPSPVRYSYDNPKAARLPAGALRSREEVEEGYRTEEAVLKFLVEEFFPANPGSRFLSSADIKKAAANGSGTAVSRATLQRAAADLLDRWRGTFIASFARADNRYFSIAEMFQLLTSALADLHRSGSLPETVRLSQVYGPLDLTGDMGPNTGEVSLASIAKASAELDPVMKSHDWTPVPRNAVPSAITVDGIRLTPGQFLRLMALAVRNPDPHAAFKIEMCHAYSEAGLIFPYMPRLYSELGATWTVKPAPLAW
jgi:hypothetical protein